jgi:hypothetical protein
LADVFDREEFDETFVGEEIEFEDIGNDRQLDVFDEMYLHIIVEEFNKYMVHFTDRPPSHFVVPYLC